VKTRWKKLIGISLAGGVVCAWVLFKLPYFQPLRAKFVGAATVADRVAQYGTVARERLAPLFQRAGVAYPPARFVLAAFKHERELHLFAGDDGTPLALVKIYPVLAASGRLGPKLRAGDRQVPEGIYTIDSLNPNSRFHLSLRLNYPNEFDQMRAEQDGRSDLGGDIMIHGDAVSIGCLAMGDAAAEELFVLAADVGWQKGRVVISPVDFRRTTIPVDFLPPTPWTADLHALLRTEIGLLPR
jgi:L,D-transpeptidase catalytic domain